MTPLRKEYTTLLTLRGYAQRTHKSYIEAVAALAKYYWKSPEILSDDEIRAYLVSLNERGLSFSTINIAVSSFRMFFGEVLKRPMDELKELLPRRRGKVQRPRVYAKAELKKLFEQGCREPVHRTFLMTVYGAGLRLEEACRLKVVHPYRERPNDAQSRSGKRKEGSLHDPKSLAAARVAGTLASRAAKMLGL